MKYLLAIVFLSVASASWVQLTRDEQCEGTLCPNGCCPNVGWYCCNLGCAANPADCPIVAKKTQLSKMAAPKQCDGTPCPGGFCCPYVGWTCCPESMYCANKPADCPFVSKKTQVTKIAQHYLYKLAAKIKEE